MDRKGITQADLSRAVNVSRATVSNWLSGSRTPSYANLLRISKAVGMSISELMGEEIMLVESRQEHDVVSAMREMDSSQLDVLMRLVHALSQEKSE